MVSLSDLMSIGKILLDSGKIDLYQKLSAISENLSQLQQENIELKNKITRLEENFRIKEELVVRGNAYWKESDNDGPFCTRCWDKDKDLIRMQDRNNVMYTCPECKTIFDGPDRNKVNTANKQRAISYSSGSPIRQFVNLVPKLQLGNAIFRRSSSFATFQPPDPMRSRYTIRESGVPYFVTCTTVQWLPIFTRKPYFDILLDSLRFCRVHKGLKVYAYVILDNHLHLVVAAGKLTDILRDFKSYTAKLLIARLEQDHKTWVLNQLQYHKKTNKTQSDYQVWQEGFHPQQIISEEMLHQKVDYLHYNPVRIGVVERPEDWLYSSARDYAGGKGLIELDALGQRWRSRASPDNGVPKLELGNEEIDEGIMPGGRALLSWTPWSNTRKPGGLPAMAFPSWSLGTRTTLSSLNYTLCPTKNLPPPWTRTIPLPI